MAPHNPLTRRGFLSATFLGIAASLPGEAAVPTRGETPAACESQTGEQPRLYDTFRHPPDSARPMTRWWWFGGAATPQEITRELEMMREVGLRGVELQPVYPLEVDSPERGIRNVRFFSQEWFDLLRHTAKETKRLGLQFDLTLGSGWPYGGPFIPVELAARRLRVLLQDVSGPGEYTWDLSPQLVGEERVVATVATPVLASQQPDVSRSRVITDQIKEITANNLRVGMGLNRWPVPAGEWRIMVFIDSPTILETPQVGSSSLRKIYFYRANRPRSVSEIDFDSGQMKSQGFSEEGLG